MKTNINKRIANVVKKAGYVGNSNSGWNRHDDNPGKIYGSGSRSVGSPQSFAGSDYADYMDQSDASGYQAFKALNWS
jgi:hypothetical protein